MGPWAVSIGEQIVVYDISGNPLFRVANEQVARNAVRAVNSHDELVAALYAAVEFIGAGVPDTNCSCHISPPCGDCVEFSGHREVLDSIKAALAKAEGGK